MAYSTNIKRLARRLKRAADAYYNTDSTMSDATFDRNKKRLEKMAPDHPFLMQVGATPSESSPLQKVEHQIPMGSLNNAKDEKEFKKWSAMHGKIGYVCQPKMDGVSIELVYENGKLIQALTRGDGTVGEDVTHTMSKAKVLGQLPKRVSCSVRGEAVLHKDVWREHFVDYANPRNAVSGLVRRLDAVGAEHIDFYAFDIEMDDEFFSEHEKITYMEEDLELECVTTKLADSWSVVSTVFKQMEIIRDDLPFEIDGMVVKINDCSIQKKKGEQHGRPRWAVAWKFEPRGDTTVVEDVEFSVGHTGAITPVAKVTPVHVGGITIQSITLCNWDEIERLGVAINDTVMVVRAGDVIPKITEVVEESAGRKKIDPPETCPECGENTFRDGASLKCSGSNCAGQKRRQLQNWVNKRDILYLGKKTVENLADAGWTIVDLYKSTQDQFERTGGLGSVMAKKIIKSLDKSKSVTLPEYLGALGLPSLGTSLAEQMVEGLELKTIGDVFKVKKKDLVKLEGWGEIRAEEVLCGLNEEKDFIKYLATILDIEKPRTSPTVTDGVLSGKSFCFTGAITMPRKQAQELVVLNGGEVKGSVGKGLTYLVQADPSSTSNKTRKAEKNRTEIISEKQFMNLLK